jgi:membrane fusion protein, multidrug efflux system
MIDAASVQLGYTKITAPISGRLGYRLIDQGNLVSASQQTGIVSIAQIEPIAVTFTQPQDRVDEINAELKNGPLMTTVIDSKGDPIATGKLIVTDNQVDVLSGTIKLKAEFDNKDHRLWPGLAVTVGLQLGVEKDAILIPTQAVQHGQDNLFVYVVDEQNRVVLRKIRVAHQNTVETAIADGVKEGDRVVTSGAFLIQPGALVAVQDARGS